jgi:hypothetical protein
MTLGREKLGIIILVLLVLLILSISLSFAASSATKSKTTALSNLKSKISALLSSLKTKVTAQVINPTGKIISAQTLSISSSQGDFSICAVVNIFNQSKCFDDYVFLKIAPYNGSQINYTMIFPPVLNCTASSADFPANSLKFFRMNKSGSSETLYTYPGSCKGTCVVTLPSDPAKKILPEDKVLCGLDNTGYGMDMPSFDIYPVGFSLLNVIITETSKPVLVRDKKAMACVIPSFNSSLINYMDKKINVSLAGLGSDKIDPYLIGEQYKNKIELKNMLDAELSSNPSTPDKAIYLRNRLKSAKTGKDCLSIFNVVPLNQSRVQNYKITLDSGNQIGESSESNNNVSGQVVFVNVKKKIHIIFYAMLVENQALNQSTSLPRVNIPMMVDHVNKVFPEVTVTYNISKTPKIIQTTEDLSTLGRQPNDSEEIKVINRITPIREEMMALLAPERTSTADTEDYAVGIANTRFLRLIGDDGQPIYAAGLYGGSTLIADSAPIETLAHEIGHSSPAWLYTNLEQYQPGPIGNPPIGFDSSFGWVLDQKTGKGFRAVNNIYNDSVYNISDIEPLKYDKINYSKYTLNPTVMASMKEYSILGDRYYDMMAGGGASSRWSRWGTTYKTLLAKFTDWNPSKES